MAELAPEDAIVAERQPTQIFTDGYLNDPIQFTSDVRFTPETLIRQNQLFVIVDRDSADFATFNINASGSVFYPAAMYSPIYARDKYFQQINTVIEPLS